MTKKQKVLTGILVYLVVVGIIIAVISQTDSFKEAGNETSSQNQKTEQVAKKNTEPTLESALEERLVYWVNKANAFNLTDVKISYENATVEIKSNVGSVWNEDRLITVGCEFGLDATKNLFNHCPEISTINFVFNTEMTDALGNTSNQKVFSYLIRRATHEKINYENFRPMVMSDYNSMWNAAESVFIHPGIKAALKKLR